MEGLPTQQNVNERTSGISQFESEKLEQIEKVKDIFSEIDQNDLQEVIQEILKSLEASDLVGRLIIPEKISIEYIEIKKIAGFFPKEDGDSYIFLNAFHLGKKKRKDENLFEVLHAYVHEQVHAISFDGKVYTSYDEKNTNDRYFGFEEQKKDIISKKTERSFVELNEGMTELITDSIVENYLKRRGDIPSKWVDILMQENKTERYLIGRDEIELLKNQLAVEYSVPPDVIFKGMVRFYFLKEDAFLSFPEWLKIHHAELAKKAKNIDSI